jgi:hypothetical protein
MTDPQRKLTVRVKMAPEAGPDVTENTKYAYRWDRIALVGLALVVVVTLFFRALLTPDQAPAEGAGATGPGGDTIAASPPTPAAAIAEPEPAPAPAERTEEPTPAIAETESSVAPAPPPQRLPAAQPDSAIAAAPTAELQAENPAAQPPAATASSATPAVSGSRDTGEQAPAPAAPPARASLLAAGETRIFSDNVTRFLLTDEVRNREPVGGLSDIRARPPGGPLAVFAFSDVRGLVGETLRYRWIRADKVAAEVKVRVGSNRWRSYSSKFISGTMRGSWRVELRNSADDLLARADFKY